MSASASARWPILRQGSTTAGVAGTQSRQPQPL